MSTDPIRALTRATRSTDPDQPAPAPAPPVDVSRLRTGLEDHDGPGPVTPDDLIRAAALGSDPFTERAMRTTP